GPALRVKTLEHAYRLEEVKGERLSKEMGRNTAAREGFAPRRRRRRGFAGQCPPFRWWFAYRTGCSPARGGHFLKYPSPCLVLPMSWVKEFMEAYNPRKRSRTQAKRKAPVPTYFGSSNSIVTSTPRANPLAVGPPVRPTTRRLDTLRTPSIMCRVTAASCGSTSGSEKS